MSQYINIPILEAAHRCALKLNPRTLSATGVEAYCPFCNDRNAHYHLYLNTAKNRWYCQHCGEKGNSVTLYAKIFHVSNSEAFQELTQNRVLRFIVPQHPRPKEAVIASLETRHDVYFDLLHHLTLSDKHRSNLQSRGLSDRRIEENFYKTMPEDWKIRQSVAETLSKKHNLVGVPGFYYQYGKWQMWGKSGFLIPVLTADGLIQGMQIRLDDTLKRKYRWLSSNPDYVSDKGEIIYPYGAKAASFVHVTGNTHKDIVCVTEGALKGDIASFLRDDALFVCTAGSHGNRALFNTLQSLSPKKVILCYDMDHVYNKQVADSIVAMKAVITEELHLNCEVFYWNPEQKGIDDFLLHRKILKAA